jgi:voltage-gated potassium channel Kch
MRIPLPRTGQSKCRAIYRDQEVVLEEPADWPEGTELVVTPILVNEGLLSGEDGHVIIVGFGLAGRYIAELIETANLRYTVLERNPVTVETQRALGREIIEGKAADKEALIKAGLHDAAILALTIPDEEAVLEATSLARRLRPDVYIIARTNYSSKGMRASQLGADEVVKAEQAVALQFYEKLRLRLGNPVGKKRN